MARGALSAVLAGALVAALALVAGPAPAAAFAVRSAAAPAPRLRSALAPATTASPAALRAAVAAAAAATDAKAFVVGLAADSGCGKSTFMRRMTAIFGGESKLLDIGRETNTLVSDKTTVICLDDYHLYDRQGRKENDITALHKDCQKWDLMAEQVAALKAGDKVMKPIYNHITGELDPDEEITPTDIVIFEGLHPMLDDRVRANLDLSIYLDISDDVKFAWKIQRDMQERGHSLESIKAAIEGRKPDFEAFVAPQRKDADIVIEVLPSELEGAPDDGTRLRVRYIQKKGLPLLSEPFLFDEGATLSFTPAESKVQAKAPGLKLASYDEEYMGKDCVVIEMDGSIEELAQVSHLEKCIGNSGAKGEGEMAKLMEAQAEAPGSDNGTGLFQTLCSFKIREAYEAATGSA